jgi:hypothetical protein
LQVDDHLKRLLRDLGNAINETVGESERITGAIANIRSSGYEIMLKLDATIGLARREAAAAQFSRQDRHFLKSLQIQMDPEALDEEPPAPKFELTPQDVRFLKSLKISLDDES